MHTVVQLAEAVEALAAPVVEERAPVLPCRSSRTRLLARTSKIVSPLSATFGRQESSSASLPFQAVDSRRVSPVRRSRTKTSVVRVERQVPGVVLERVRLDDVRVEAAVGEEAAVGREPPCPSPSGWACRAGCAPGWRSCPSGGRAGRRPCSRPRGVHVRGAGVEGDVAAGAVEVTEGGRVRRHLAGSVAVDQLRPADVDGRLLRRVRGRRGDHQERQSDDQQDRVLEPINADTPECEGLILRLVGGEGQHP